MLDLPTTAARSLLTRTLVLILLGASPPACAPDDDGEPWVDQDTDGTRILPLGDSITQGDAEHLSYRYPLWAMLVDEGYEFDFVGSMTGNYQGDPVWPPHAGLEFDRDHEGHWGWHANQLLDGLSGWLESCDPQIVLLHAGTNDAFADQPAEQIAAELAEIVEVLRDDVPEVVILLARPLPTAWSEPDEILEDLGEELDALAATYGTEESPIEIVDMREGFDAESDTYDGIHPDEGGEQKMAERWYAALEPYLL